MNWVEHRVHCERVLDAKSGDVWNDLRGTIKDACDSYNAHYPATLTMHAVSCKLENDNHISVSRSIHDSQTGVNSTFNVLVAFDSDTFTITVARDNGSHADLRISGDEDGAFLLKGEKQVTPDEVSRLVLEPILFSEVPHRQLQS